ncbi:ER membrane protein complex subunit 2 [Hypsibius exemplaris]|uniref:ER membrane protein complex subunit 2 n=1 Tax=Hypsibius exemplaris TaxID=2072580 RepID=A0A1W0XCP5_HYPEX|nr:ER membrane protein complex subunit 2 [Hypsibius exemplaris]
MTWQEARDRLKKIKEERLRRSDEVVELWEGVLSKNTRKLGDEVWTVYEQVCIAALDCDRLDISRNCVKLLDARFPNSSRVKRLAGMNLEADGKFDDAIRMYEALTKADETDTLSRKRLIAILKTQKKYRDAIEELTDYLKTFQNDQEAWLELVELFCHELDYNKASFCMEEALIHHPHNHLYHQRYAEIRYALGGFENIDTARTHFAKAVQLCRWNTDALYGMCICASHLAISQKATAQKRRDNQRYGEWASNQLIEKHSDKLGAEGRSKVKNISLLLEQLQV